MIDANEMVALIESCRHEMQAMLPADEFASLSSKTRQDYRQLGRTLLQRARYAEGGVAEVMTATQRPTTFYKRVKAALPVSAASVPASGKPCAASPATGASNCISALRKASMPMRFWSPR